ncbi:hypothetical protein VNO77_36906 [Canavalia gladiata]|uniref:Uncharacterized protein n=1 Tax=Canavalia gladiata TaxID=3824 RepID=A0AAN9KAK0_CANGL
MSPEGSQVCLLHCFLLTYSKFTCQILLGVLPNQLKRIVVTNTRMCSLITSDSFIKPCHVSVVESRQLTHLFDNFFQILDNENVRRLWHPCGLCSSFIIKVC